MVSLRSWFATRNAKLARNAEITRGVCASARLITFAILLI
jgi:hypothetical protein